MENLDHAVARCLDDIRRGVPEASRRLFELCYEEIHALAVGKTRQQRPGYSWDATDLAHEIYGKIVRSLPNLEDRRHFFGAVANAMRQALIDRSRRKRHSPESLARVLDAFKEDEGFEFEPLSVALDRLESIDPRSAEVVKLKFLLGLSAEEIAQLLGISKRSVERDWQHARAWLKRSIEDLSDDE